MVSISLLAVAMLRWPSLLHLLRRRFSGLDRSILPHPAPSVSMHLEPNMRPPSARDAAMGTSSLSGNVQILRTPSLTAEIHLQLNKRRD
jgi:hypothetical protein